jgi:thymidylate kinase
MSSVAVIGGDGAGKTTIARRLESVSPLPMKYLYMGTSLRSTDHALPTSRLLFLLKQRAYARRVGKSGTVAAESIPAHYMEYEQKERGPIWTVFRHLNRFLEAWYRQLISLWYQVRGYVVIYDRHFLFDSAPPVVDARPAWQVHLDALNHWLLSNFYPRPNLTVFLDAPADLLFARKREASPEYLNRQRDAYLEAGKKVANFVRVDATQPLRKVFDDVQCIVLEFHANHG